MIKVLRGIQRIRKIIFPKQNNEKLDPFFILEKVEKYIKMKAYQTNKSGPFLNKKSTNFEEEFFKAEEWYFMIFNQIIVSCERHMNSRFCLSQGMSKQIWTKTMSNTCAFQPNNLPSHSNMSTRTSISTTSQKDLEYWCRLERADKKDKQPVLNRSRRRTNRQSKRQRRWYFFWCSPRNRIEPLPRRCH